MPRPGRSVVRPANGPPRLKTLSLGWSPPTSGLPSGLSLTTPAANAAGLFSPQSRGLGLDRGEASCSVLRKITYAGVMAGTSFRQGGRSLENLAGLDVSAKQVERTVRRIGQECVDQRDA